MQIKKNVLKSRKFWASVIASVVVLLKIWLNIPDEIIKAIVIIAAVYCGSTALEDAFKRLPKDIFKK